ncbi:MAG TPA: peptidylprolyl isomerase [Casimicrobiaceae bacterium]|jgi:peptidyl-prolyl cis-trans isomerase SurA|nr:peptidylprolyl isomerase [Casimicrobiaceae bacterium]
MYVRLIVSTALALFAAGVCAQPTNAPSAVVAVDRVIAIVNDEAVTQYELDDARRVVQQQLKQQKVQPPAADVLDKQVLERLITQRALLQQAKEDGVKIDDSQVERAIQRIATENKLSAEDFRKVLAQENIPYAKYRDDIRNEMVVQRLREREIDSKVQVSDAEVDQYLATLKAQNAGETEYRVAHILVTVPEQASADQIESRRRRAEEALRSIRSGADFAQVAASFSDATDALQGGNLGWRSGARLPTIFADTVRDQKVGTVSGVLRSAAGFHIVKLLEKRSQDDATLVDQTHARHILVRVNELTSEAEAKSKIERMKDRLDSGTNFADLAKINSEDASAAKGGDLGWLSTGDTVAEFDEAMKKLQPNQVSPPVRTSFGWHLIEVLERRKQDVTIDRARNEAQTAIRQRKADEAFQDWVRQVRDKAFVEIRLDDR